MKVLGIILACFFGLVVLALLGIGMAMEAGVIPDTKVLRRSEIDAQLTDRLHGIVELAEDERIEYFYSAGLFSYEEDGNLLTDRRVISYETWDGEFTLASLPYADIASVEAELSDSEFADGFVYCWPTDADRECVVLLLSDEEDRDDEALAYLERRVAEARPADTAAGEHDQDTATPTAP